MYRKEMMTHDLSFEEFQNPFGGDALPLLELANNVFGAPSTMQGYNNNNNNINQHNSQQALNELFHRNTMNGNTQLMNNSMNTHAMAPSNGGNNAMMGNTSMIDALLNPSMNVPQHLAPSSGPAMQLKMEDASHSMKMEEVARTPSPPSAPLLMNPAIPGMSVAMNVGHLREMLLNNVALKPAKGRESEYAQKFPESMNTMPYKYDLRIKCELQNVDALTVKLVYEDGSDLPKVPTVEGANLPSNYHHKSPLVVNEITSKSPYEHVVRFTFNVCSFHHRRRRFCVSMSLGGREIFKSTPFKTYARRSRKPSISMKAMRTSSNRLEHLTQLFESLSSKEKKSFARVVAKAVSGVPM